MAARTLQENLQALGETSIFCERCDCKAQGGFGPVRGRRLYWLLPEGNRKGKREITKTTARLTHRISREDSGLFCRGTSCLTCCLPLPTSATSNFSSSSSSLITLKTHILIFSHLKGFTLCLLPFFLLSHSVGGLSGTCSCFYKHSQACVCYCETWHLKILPAFQSHSTATGVSFKTVHGAWNPVKVKAGSFQVQGEIIKERQDFSYARINLDWVLKASPPE